MSGIYTECLIQSWVHGVIVGIQERSLTEKNLKDIEKAKIEAKNEM